MAGTDRRRWPEVDDTSFGPMLSEIRVFLSNGKFGLDGNSGNFSISWTSGLMTRYKTVVCADGLRSHMCSVPRLFYHRLNLVIVALS